MKKNQLRERIQYCAVKAMLYEVAVSPKPGLVDRLNNGSHNDMDMFTFIDSALSLRDYFRDCSDIVRAHHKKDPREVFLMLRKCGCEADEQMLKATNGINTHKGAIFSMGLLAAGATYAYIKNESFEVPVICNYTKKLVADIFEADFSKSDNQQKTAGIKLYLEYGVSGIRGEAYNGFPTIQNHAYPHLSQLLEKGQSLNHACVNVLLDIIVQCEDTNIMARGGMEGLVYAKEKAKEALTYGGMGTEEGVKKIQQMDQSFINRRISPGGSADLLACTLMLYFLNERVDSI